MLSMLEILDDIQGSAIRRLWHRLRTPSVVAQMRPVENTFFLKISAQLRRDKLDWKMIRAYSLDVSERILMPEGIDPPPETGLRRYIPYEYHRRLLENMAAEILVCSPKRPELRRVAVYGQDNEVIAMLPRLVSLAGEVRVITRRPFAVADTVAELCRRTGAAVTVSEEFDASGFDMLLAPAGGSKVFTLSGDMVVIAPDRPAVPVSLWVKGARPSLPAMLEGIYDERYDLTEFVGAFYEACQIKSLGRMSPSAGLSESGEISPEEAAALISR